MKGDFQFVQLLLVAPRREDQQRITDKEHQHGRQSYKAVSDRQTESNAPGKGYLQPYLSSLFAVIVPMK